MATRVNRLDTDDWPDYHQHWNLMVDTHCLRCFELVGGWLEKLIYLIDLVKCEEPHFLSGYRKLKLCIEGVERK